MGKVNKFFRLIDLLVTPYDFTVSKNEKSMTWIGGIITMFILILIAIYSVSHFFKLTAAEDTIYAGTQSESDEGFQLSEKTTQFALEISYSKTGQVITYLPGLEQYFTVSAQYVVQTRTPGTVGFKRDYVQLPTSNCTQDKIKEFNFQKSFTPQQLANFLCFEGNYQISGQFYDTQYQYIRIEILKCNRSNCKSATEIEEFINQGINIDLFVKDSKVKKKLNLTHPAESYPMNIFWRLTSTIGNYEDIYLQPIMIDLGNGVFELIVNNGDMFSLDQEKSSRRLYQASKIRKQERRQAPIDLESATELCSFYLRIQSDSEYYFAVQNTIFSLILQSISQGSGLAVAAIGLIKVFYKFYCEHKTFETIMNYVFKFDLRESDLNYNIQDMTPLQNGQKTQKLDKLYSQKLQYRYFSFIWFKIQRLFKNCFPISRIARCMKYDKDIVLAQMAKSKIQRDMDLANIVKKLYEIDFIKLFLFDDDQLLLFNSFCYPVFYKKMIAQKEEMRQLKRTQRNVNLETLGRPVTRQKSSHMQITVNQAIKSSIPMEQRLAKLARFFKAQVSATDANELLAIFQKIKDNRNQNMTQNDKLMKFIQYNKSLYNLGILDIQRKIQRNSVNGESEKVRDLIKQQNSQFSRYKQQPNSCDDIDEALDVNIEIERSSPQHKELDKNSLVEG